MAVIPNWICIIYGNSFFLTVILSVDVRYDHKTECYADSVSEGDHHRSSPCRGTHGGEVNYGKFVGDTTLEPSLLVIPAETS